MNDPYVTPGKGTDSPPNPGETKQNTAGLPDFPDGWAYVPPGYGPYRTTNGLAWASLLMSLLWGVGVLSGLAILFGFWALAQIKHRGQDGRAIAVTGIVFGFLGLLPALFVVLAFVVGSSGL